MKGLGGAYGAAKVADSLKSHKDGKESTAAQDGILKVAPYVAGTVAVPAVAAAVAATPSAATAVAPYAGAMASGAAHVGQRAGAYVTNSARSGQYAALRALGGKHGKTLTNAPKAFTDFVEGVTLEGPPAMTWPGVVGNGLSKGHEYVKAKKR